MAIMSASGVAVGFNPNAPTGKQLHLFYNTNTENLGIELRNETKSTDETDSAAFAADGDAQSGIIINPAQIAFTPLTGVDLVMGFTKKAATSSGACSCNQNDVSIISPVYLPLAATEVNNLTIAATSSDCTAWVLYLTGTNADSTTINEVYVGDDATGNYEDTVTILPGSSLAAYYVADTDIRYVIYQCNHTKKLHEYCPKDSSGDTSDHDITNTDDAKTLTPLAITYVEGKAYLYYINTHNELRYITKSKDKWSTSGAVTTQNKVDDGSQLTVVPTTNGNHIFYVPQGQSKKFKFHHVIHKRA